MSPLGEGGVAKTRADAEQSERLSPGGRLPPSWRASPLNKKIIASKSDGADVERNERRDVFVDAAGAGAKLYGECAVNPHAYVE